MEACPFDFVIFTCKTVRRNSRKTDATYGRFKTITKPFGKWREPVRKYATGTARKRYGRSDGLSALFAGRLPLEIPADLSRVYALPKYTTYMYTE